MTSNACAGDRDIDLTIDGAEATEFSGNCTIETDAGEAEHTMSGTVPFQVSWSGTSLSCEIKQTSAEGHIEIVVHKDGNRTRSRTRGEGSTVRLTLR